jgi:hypothetical protein
MILMMRKKRKKRKKKRGRRKVRRRKSLDLKVIQMKRKRRLQVEEKALENLWLLLEKRELML